VSDLHCPARILLARHGETEYESHVMLDAGGSLTTKGRAQARALGDSLTGERVAHVYCSTKARAVQTAELAAGRLGVEVTVREDLREVGPGGWYGQPEDGSLFQPIFEAWLAGDLDAAGPEGENARAIAGRALAVLDEVADAYRGETVLAVAHGGLIHAVLSVLSPGTPESPTRHWHFENCEFVALERDADGWRVV
jgi:broad specificity phosphatase PhoE